MKYRFVYKMKFLNWMGINAITLFPFVFFADSKSKVSEQLFRHELEHLYQVEREGCFRFYFSYLRFYYHSRFKGMDHRTAYLAIPYEKEARESEMQSLTLDERKIFQSHRV